MSRFAISLLISCIYLQKTASLCFAVVASLEGVLTWSYVTTRLNFRRNIKYIHQYQPALQAVRGPSCHLNSRLV